MYYKCVAQFWHWKVKNHVCVKQQTRISTTFAVYVEIKLYLHSHGHVYGKRGKRQIEVKNFSGETKAENIAQKKKTWWVTLAWNCLFLSRSNKQKKTIKEKTWHVVQIHVAVWRKRVNWNTLRQGFTSLKSRRFSLWKAQGRLKLSVRFSICLRWEIDLRQL